MSLSEVGGTNYEVIAPCLRRWDQPLPRVVVLFCDRFSPSAFSAIDLTAATVST